MATLKEFEDALRERGMVNALAILDEIKKRDRQQRSFAPARRVVGRKMTAELARTVVEMHATTGMTQQEIAFKLGVNQGRVNEVIKRGKWLSGDPAAPEALSRDKAMDRLNQRAKSRRTSPPPRVASGDVSASTSTRSVKVVVKPVTGSVPFTEAVTKVQRRTAEAELPLLEPACAAPSLVPPGSKPGLRRHAEAPSPIISAQLAFLDFEP